MKQVVGMIAAFAGITGIVLLLFAPHIGIPLATIGAALSFTYRGM